MTGRLEQRQRRTAPHGGAGVGVDAAGGPVIDPTENVLALVDVEKAHARELRAADLKYHERTAADESRRLDDLARLRAEYERRISDMLSVQVKTTSDLISTQLDKVTSDLRAQITNLTASTQAQIQILTNAMNERLAQLERFRYETGGKTSVSDPATSAALVELTTAIRRLQTSGDQTTGKGVGRAEFVIFIGVLIAAAGVLFGFFHR